MSDDFVWNLVVPALTFSFTVGVLWAGIRAKLENILNVHKLVAGGIDARIDTLEETIDKRFTQTCSTCKENTHRVEQAITKSHGRIDDCLKRKVS